MADSNERLKENQLHIFVFWQLVAITQVLPFPKQGASLNGAALLAIAYLVIWGLGDGGWHASSSDQKMPMMDQPPQTNHGFKIPKADNPQTTLSESEFEPCILAHDSHKALYTLCVLT